MARFTYDKISPCAEYYEILEDLMERGEHEIVEFKEAKGQYNTDRIGQYFSAISNEANLRQQQYGWFILGVSEGAERVPVGTNFKTGAGNLEKFKYEIAKKTSDGITFIDIIELFPVANDREHRVLMFQIPAAATGIPTGWNNHYYARSGESLDSLSQHKIDRIRSQERADWSRQILEGAKIEHLDREAIQFARISYKLKMDRSHISEEVDKMSDEEFLAHLRLVVDGKVTNAAMVLLGKHQYDTLFKQSPTIMWRLFDGRKDVSDYEIYTIPFINVVDKLFENVRNRRYQYIPNRLSQNPETTRQYDKWLVHELMNNCIAHTNYRLGGRIYLDEFDDKIVISNPGEFLPGTVKAVFDVNYRPPFYQNQLLAQSMASFRMIDTAVMGIRKVFKIQKEKFFPMPDYGNELGYQVTVTVHGKSLNDDYLHILYDYPDLSLRIVYLLDRIQKGMEIASEEAKELRTLKLVEGRVTNLKVASHVREKDMTVESAMDEGRGNQYYKDLIVDYLRKYNKAKRSDIRNLLWDELSDKLNAKQKDTKIKNLLASLNKDLIIEKDSDNQQRANWVLK